MGNYYEDKLSAKKWMKCYEIAPPRVKQYLEVEVNYVLQKIHPNDIVLELGCGYGRILPQLASKARFVIGIDTSLASLFLGREMLVNVSNCSLLNMNAVQLAFRDHIFDCVVCIQNGISAFHVNPYDLIQESVRVTKTGGTVLFSSYSGKFWEDRLRWFQLQLETGLLGEIDYEKTQDGMIVCKDGFTATTFLPHQFLSLTAELNLDAQITEIDKSSLFCEITP